MNFKYVEKIDKVANQIETSLIAAKNEDAPAAVIDDLKKEQVKVSELRQVAYKVKRAGVSFEQLENLFKVVSSSVVAIKDAVKKTNSDIKKAEKVIKPIVKKAKAKTKAKK